ncbi:MAG: LysR family transcriptional regulator [Pseudomonadota bacterium]
MNVFAEVSKHGGFAPAARALGLSTSSVNRQVIELETWLGVALFQRTTRKLSLTEEGAYYLNECQKVVDDVERIQNTANEALTHPTGKLRLTAPVFLAKECLQDLLPEFLNTFPDLKVELTAVDRFVDLVDEGFDLALRIGELPDSTLIARRLGDIRLTIVASPAYLDSRGEPNNAEELKQHNCIVDTAARFSNRWPLKHANKRQYVTVSGNVTVNNGEIARNLAVGGLGLALLPQFFVLDQLSSGKLVEVLEGQADSYAGIYAVYPQSRHLTPRVRAFIDHLVAYFEHLK